MTAFGAGSADILARICADTRRETARRQREVSEGQLREMAHAMDPPRGFAAALASSVAAKGFGLIAEIKRASPSKGLIRPDFDPATLARAYAEAGAACLSVLTDGPYFQGESAHLEAARAAVALPVLRKDFMLDPWQILESRAIGADCVLLIMAALQDDEAVALERAALDLGLDVLVEVHDAAELERCRRLSTPLIGINNRNLKTLAVDLATTEALAPLLPAGRDLVCESGIGTPADVARMQRAGARRYLIGESFMREADVAAAVRRLFA